MSTRQTIEGYFDALRKEAGWQDALATDMTFTSYTSPVKQLAGRDAYLQATKRFYSTIANFEVRRLLVDGEHAIALTRYTIQPSNGAPSFESDVAESFTVRNGKITSFDIYFDSAPFPK
ncbi:MAG TPA: nuclear transport factor 2 family protein [Gemmatimonadaceae bacterium]